MMLVREHWAAEEADVVAEGAKGVGRADGLRATQVDALLLNVTESVDLFNGDDSGRDERLAQVSGPECVW